MAAPKIEVVKFPEVEKILANENLKPRKKVEQILQTKSVDEIAAILNSNENWKNAREKNHESLNQILAKISGREMINFETQNPGFLFSVLTFKIENDFREVNFFNSSQQRNIGLGNIFNSAFRDDENFVTFYDETGDGPRFGEFGKFKFRGRDRVGFGDLAVENDDEKYLQILSGAQFKTFENFGAMKTDFNKKNLREKVDETSEIPDQVRNDKSGLQNNKSEKIIDFAKIESAAKNSPKVSAKEIQNCEQSYSDFLNEDKGLRIDVFWKIDEIRKSKNANSIAAQKRILDEILNDENAYDFDEKEIAVLRNWKNDFDRFSKNTPDFLREIDSTLNFTDLIRKINSQISDFEKFDKNEIEKIIAQLRHESAHFNIFAFSKAGAFGFGQIIPATAADLKVNRFNPLENIYGALKYMRQLCNNEKIGGLPIAMLAYNGGPNRVKKYFKNFDGDRNDFQKVYDFAQTTNLPRETKKYLKYIAPDEIETTI